MTHFTGNLSELAQRYRIDETIAEGGMGRVYSAEVRESGARVAIKLLHPKICNDAAFVEAFLQTAEKMAAVDHANLVRIVDYGRTEKGAVYIVTELLEGVDLGTLLARDYTLDYREVVDIGVAVCRALSALHRKGIQHLDIKPSNIFVMQRKGATKQPAQVKLIDFGVGRLPEAPGAPSLNGQMWLGVPEYWSPELATGRPTDARSDVYALGIVLYESLCGHTPFRSHSYSDLIAMHVRSDPKPLPQPPNRLSIPDPLKGVVMHCLKKNPRERFQSAARLADMLARSLAPRRAVNNPLARRPAAVALIGASLLSVTIAGIALSRQIPREPPKTPAAAIAQVAIDISSEPTGALVVDTADGSSYGTTPVRMELPRADKRIGLLLQFSGGESVRTDVVPNRSTRIHIQAPSLANGVAEKME